MESKTARGRQFILAHADDKKENTDKLASLASLSAATKDLSLGKKLEDLIRVNVIGADLNLPTPFGLRKVTYLDYTASGRSLSFIEGTVTLSACGSFPCTVYFKSHLYM